MNEITLYQKIQDPMTVAVQLGKPFAVMFGLTSEAQGVFLAFAAMAEQQTPFKILRTFDICEGKLRKKALAMYAEFRALGGKVKWLDTGKDGIKAAAEFTFEGQTLAETFTIEEARKQNLVKPNSAWAKTPANMLRSRLLSNTIAMLCPEILAGMSENPEDETQITDKPLLLSQPESKSKPIDFAAAAAKKRESQVINVVPEQSAAGGSAPEPAAETALDPTLETPIPSAPLKSTEIEWAEFKNPNKIGANGVAALMDVIPGAAQKAVEDWLIKEKWIQKFIDELSPKRAKKIYESPEKFLAHIGWPPAPAAA